MQYRISGEGWEQQFQVQRGPLGREWEVTPPDGDPVAFHVERLEAGVFRITIGSVTHTLTLLPGCAPGQLLRYLLDDEYIELGVLDEFDLLDQELGTGGSGSGHVELCSVMPGIIRKVLVEEGDTVSVGQPLLILEAMKMENEIGSPAAGTVERLEVSEGATVAAGQRMVVILPE